MRPNTKNPRRKRRVRLSQKQYQELIESRDWCVKNQFGGMLAYYNEELRFQASRRALPQGAIEYQHLADEREERMGRGR